MQLKKSNFDNKMQIDAAFEKCNVRVSCSVSNFNLIVVWLINPTREKISPSSHHSCDSNEDALLTLCIVVLIPYRDYIILTIREKMFSVYVTPSL